MKAAANANIYPIEPLALGRSLVPVKTKSLVPSGALIDHSNDIDRMVSRKPAVPAMDVRQMSPRKMAHLSMDLYVAGIIEWKEHEMLAFQAELHPDYNKSIGALTGEPAKPDHPKDFIEEWERRLTFQRRHNPDNVRRLRRTEHIKNILNQIDAPTHLLV
ncbi:MAG: hypothetical protein HQ513_15095 [Rhodospirillales bacterium]|nr:hypothetical protein [Rhodospirillales bacterium]